MAIPNVAEYIDEESARKIVFPRAKAIYEKNSTDLLVSECHICHTKLVSEYCKRSSSINDLTPGELGVSNS